MLFSRKFAEDSVRKLGYKKVNWLSVQAIYMTYHFLWYGLNGGFKYLVKHSKIHNPEAFLEKVNEINKYIDDNYHLHDELEEKVLMFIKSIEQHFWIEKNLFLDSGLFDLPGNWNVLVTLIFEKKKFDKHAYLASFDNLFSATFRLSPKKQFASVDSDFVTGSSWLDQVIFSISNKPDRILDLDAKWGANLVHVSKGKERIGVTDKVNNYELLSFLRFVFEEDVCVVSRESELASRAKGDMVILNLHNLNSSKSVFSTKHIELLTSLPNFMADQSDVFIIAPSLLLGVNYDLKYDSILKMFIDEQQLKGVFTLPKGFGCNGYSSSSILWLSNKHFKKGKILLAELNNANWISGRKSDLSFNINDSELEWFKEFGLDINKWKNGERLQSGGVYFEATYENVKNNKSCLIPEWYAAGICESLCFNSLVKMDVFTHSYEEFGELVDEDSGVGEDFNAIEVESENYVVINADVLRQLKYEDILSLDILTSNLNSKSVSDYKVITDVDILLVERYGELINPILIPKNYDFKNRHILYDDTVSALEIDVSKVLPEYLVIELNKPYVKTQIRLFADSNSLNRLSDIYIDLKSLLEQTKIVEEHKKLQFLKMAQEDGFKKQIDLLKEKQTESIRLKRHSLMQHVGNLSNSLSTIELALSIKGRLDKEEILSPDRNLTTEKYIEMLQSSLKSTMLGMDELLEVQSKIPESVNLKLVTNEVANLYALNKEFDLSEETMHPYMLNSEEFVWDVLFNTEVYKEVLNNIFENAIKHGFKDSKKKNLIKIEYDYVGGSIHQIITNNGAPFSREMISKLGEKGAKGEATGNTGFGVFINIEKLMYYDIEFEIIDRPEHEFPVGWKLIFNLNN